MLSLYFTGCEKETRVNVLPHIKMVVSAPKYMAKVRNKDAKAIFFGLGLVFLLSAISKCLDSQIYITAHQKT